MHPHLSASEIERVATNEMRINNIRNPKIIEERVDYQRKCISKNYGIFSMTSENDNILMWTHYANSHKGICIRLNVDQFLNFIKNDCVKEKLLIIWDKVEYQNEYPLLNPFILNDDEVVLKSLLIKSWYWKYESEYRFILFENPNRAIKIPIGIIDQIIMGCNISESDKGELVEIAKSRNIELLKADLKRNSFGLDINKLD